ncbi:hypothetical protein [Mangrovimonas futianensis]|uniref:hypothetical protein n=1 Tax=Mangrovimonas futianensis TaxID=2895523 RepID=UPI001E637835|nr:hypothetical protein [Mangrovimonas futianensis]MCF1193902.1 hypothetical protein [Mangrovimonas futianensis]
MNKFLLQIVFLLFVTSTYSQLVFNFSKKEYIPCEIELSDGNTLRGFVKDFDEPNAVEFSGYQFSIESRTNLDRKFYTFVKELKGEKQDIMLEDIQSILLKDEDTIKYEKIKVKTINSNMEVVDLNREVMIPLLREGDINLYGIKVYNCGSGMGCEMAYVLAYIKNENQEHAYIPIDFNRINLFNLGKIGDKFLKSFEMAGSDCPAFLEYLEEQKVLFDDKSFQKAHKEDYKNFRKEVKQKLKTIKGGKNKRKEEDKLYAAFFVKMYTDMIDEYSSRCHDI